MTRRPVSEGLALVVVVALWGVLGCGDGILGAAGGETGDTGSAADLVSPEDTTMGEDSLPELVPEDSLPDNTPLPDTAPDSVDVVNPEDTEPPPDTEPEGCWSCTTEDPNCLCGCVACHTDKPRLQELAPLIPVEEPAGGGG